EQKDLSKAKPEVTKKLLKMLHDWRREVDAKMPQVKTATSSSKPKNPPTAGTALPADVATFAPGWKIRDWGGPKMKPGLRREWDGRKKVLLTHPRSQSVPCVLSRKIEVPAGKKTTLDLEVTNHPKGDWKLVVLINGVEALSRDIEETKWQQLQIDLSRYAGKSVSIELENRATGWAHEAAYWSRIQIVH
ncbi:MAG: hypothetical protein QGG01_08600, partial [Roseibacillus sp.]|nr:hypothetical protein [Roseibacillus sp.]